MELMAASDNVLRGGLTAKHVDVDELLSVVIPTVLPIPLLEPLTPTPGLELFRPDVPDFELARVTGDIDSSYSLDLTRPAIAVCTEGSMTLHGGTSNITLDRGEICLILAEENNLRFAGSGELFVAI
jgi:mannose-6-phosphate isomerase